MTKPSPKKERVERAARSGPEWIIFGASAAIVAGVVGVLVVLAFRTADPAAPTADTPGSAEQIGNQFLVPVDIVNQGDRAAAEVQVVAELTINGTTTSGDQVVDFLGGGETQELTFVFTDDPADGELVITVTGFAAP
jgi:uncharacterized protein (TIGR02588 family)